MSPSSNDPSAMSTSTTPSAVVRVTIGGSERGAMVAIASFSFSRPPSGACTGEFSRTVIGGGVTAIGDSMIEAVWAGIGGDITTV